MLYGSNVKKIVEIFSEKIHSRSYYELSPNLQYLTMPWGLYFSFSILFTFITHCRCSSEERLMWTRIKDNIRYIYKLLSKKNYHPGSRQLGLFRVLQKTYSLPDCYSCQIILYRIMILMELQKRTWVVRHDGQPTGHSVVFPIFEYHTNAFYVFFHQYFVQICNYCSQVFQNTGNRRNRHK